MEDLGFELRIVESHSSLRLDRLAPVRCSCSLLSSHFSSCFGPAQPPSCIRSDCCVSSAELLPPVPFSIVIVYFTVET